MSLTTRIESIIPRLSHFQSEVAQQIKALHPKKVLVRNWGRFVQGMRIVAFHAKRLAHGIADRIPRIRISTRRVVQVKTEGAILNRTIKAKSKEGLKLTQVQYELLNGKTGFVIETRGEPGKAQTQHLVKVKSSALKQSEKAFEESLEAFVQARTDFDAKQVKTPYETLNASGQEERKKEHAEMKRLETEMLGKEQEYIKLRAMATRLKLREIGGQHDTKAALRDALRFHAKAEAAKLADAGSLVTGVASSVQSVTQKRKDIDADIKAVSEKYRHKVYKDIKAFIDNDDENSEHNTLVRAQRNRQMVKGTDKLRFATRDAGHAKRLPGLDYYMCAAREKMKADGKTIYKDRLVLEAVRMMHNDWSLFAHDVQGQIDQIRVDEDEKTGKKGSFDADRMWEYHHLRSFQETLAKLRRLATIDEDSQSRVVDFLSSYGEELGLGEHPGYNLDVLMKEAEVKYGVNNFKLLEGTVPRTELGVEAHPEYLPIQPFSAFPPPYSPGIDRTTAELLAKNGNPFSLETPPQVYPQATRPGDHLSSVTDPLPPTFGSNWQQFEDDTSPLLPQKTGRDKTNPFS
ncbi:hypothetical protein [Endozoicomonas arenosclerae]|uniref:hypothetical protein n=1 Tax=Endozoicomonas arenosclerae TaxID=1633495 RepID=UPI000783FB51|nr:hypothetical protein [Endozoicomonas arenosclerae]